MASPVENSHPNLPSESQELGTIAETLPIAESDDGKILQTGPSNSESEIVQPECPVCLQMCIHPARLPCGHVFCFLCVKGVAFKNRRCAMCRRDIPPSYLDHPQLVNGLRDVEKAAKCDDDTKYQWYYKGTNGWWQYDERTSQELEDAYQRQEQFCKILVAGFVYIVDFEQKCQIRQNNASKIRQVKRDLASIPKKGVAGLRLAAHNDLAATPARNLSNVLNENEENGVPNEQGSRSDSANDAETSTAEANPSQSIMHRNIVADEEFGLQQVIGELDQVVHRLGELALGDANLSAQFERRRSIESNSLELAQSSADSDDDNESNDPVIL